MSAVLIVVPVFALIAAGYAAVALRFISPTAHKGISEFAFSIAIPALLFRIVVARPHRHWGRHPKTFTEADLAKTGSRLEMKEAAKWGGLECRELKH